MGGCRPALRTSLSVTSFPLSSRLLEDSCLGSEDGALPSPCAVVITLQPDCSATEGEPGPLCGNRCRQLQPAPPWSSEGPSTGCLIRSGSVLSAQGAMRPYSYLGILAAVVAWWGRRNGLIRNRRQSLCVFVPHGRPPSVTLHGIRLIGSAADTWHNPSPHRESSGRGAPESGCCRPTSVRES